MIVGMGEIDDFRPLFGDGDAGHGDIDRPGLEGGNQSLEIHRLHLDGQSFFLGDGADQIDVEAGDLTVLLHFKRRERGVRTNRNPFFLGIPGQADAGDTQHKTGTKSYEHREQPSHLETSLKDLRR